MKEAKSIKIWDGWRVYFRGKVHEFTSPPEVWEFFGWDNSDQKTNEITMEITRAMYCFGHLDLTESVGETLVIDVIPVKENDYDND